MSALVENRRPTIVARRQSPLSAVMAQGFPVSRRSFVIGGASLLLPLGTPSFANTARNSVVLLGTKGGPTPSPYRAPASVLLVIEGRPYVVDTPNGVAGQLAKAGIKLTEISQIFITHNHSDHVIDAGTLLVLAWGAGLNSAVDLHGPPPLQQIVRHSLAASRFDLAARMREEGRGRLDPLVRVHERSSAGLVYEDPRVKVTSALVDHYTVKPAFAYRFDTAGRSIVVSGDTTYCPRLVELARGADLLIHEAMYLPGIDKLAGENAPRLREHLLRSHSTTEQVGMVAAEAGVRKLVLSHLVPASPEITDEMWLEGVRKHFAGEAIVGRDLQEV
jgi:ribonuclease BN (tRNA processing enzyme)